MLVITVPVMKNKESEMVLSVVFELAKKLRANVHAYHLLPGKRGLFRPDNLFTRLTSDGKQKELTHKELETLAAGAEQIVLKMGDEMDTSL